jgi:hypothetical protein
MPVSVAPLIACPPSRLPMAQCPWPNANANAAPLRRWHVKDGRHEAPFPIPIPSHSALPLLILSLLRGPAITIAITPTLHPHPHPHHTTTPHPHPLPHPSVSFLFAPAAAAVRFSLPTSTNHLSPMLPAVPLNRRDGVRLLSSVVPWSSAPHTALYAQLTNPRPQSIPQFPNSSIPQSQIPTEGPVCATPLHPPSARAPPPAHRPALADDPGVCNTARPCSWPCSLPAWLPLTLS